MRFYYTAGVFFPTKAEACAHAREEAKESYHAITVQPADVATDRANLLRLLNDNGAGVATMGGIVYTTRGRKKGEGR